MELYGCPLTPAVTPDRQRNKLIVIIGISVSCSVFVLLLFCVLFWIKRRQQCHNKSEDNKGSERTEMPLLPPVNEPWEIKEGQLTILETIGEGAFAQVFKGTVNAEDFQMMGQTSSALKHKQHRELHVAVKKLRAHADSLQKEQFLQEIEMMKILGQHKNIVNMVACCTSVEPFLLVMEFLPKGDLLNHLRNIRTQVPNSSNILGPKKSSLGNKTVHSDNQMKDTESDIQFLPKCGSSAEVEEDMSHFGLSDLHSVSWQIACGMEYLASKGFVHRDLAARNVLIGDNKTVKVSDFGLSRSLYDGIYHMKKTKKVPIRWMPLESILYEVFTTKSDVWAYGVLMWEIATLGEVPYPELRNRELIKSLRGGYRMEKPEMCSDEIYQIMTSCWSECPEDRPTFTQLRERLESMMERETPYLDLNSLGDGMPTYFNVFPKTETTSSSSDNENDYNL